MDMQHVVSGQTFIMGESIIFRVSLDIIPRAYFYRSQYLLIFFIVMPFIGGLQIAHILICRHVVFFAVFCPASGPIFSLTHPWDNLWGSPKFEADLKDK